MLSLTKSLPNTVGARVEWRLANVVPIFKEEDISEMSNDHHITLTLDKAKCWSLL